MDVSQLADLGMNTKGISDAFGFRGFSILGVLRIHLPPGVIFLHFTPFGERAGKSDMTATAIAGRLTQQFSTVRQDRRQCYCRPRLVGSVVCRRLYNAG